MADEVEEIMARALLQRTEERFVDKIGNGCTVYTWEQVPQWHDELLDNVQAQIAALHAAGYKIKKLDPDMLSVAEVSTDRPIGR